MSEHNAPIDDFAVWDEALAEWGDGPRTMRATANWANRWVPRLRTEDERKCIVIQNLWAAVGALEIVAEKARAWAAVRMEYKALEAAVVQRFADAGRPAGRDAWTEDEKKQNVELQGKMLSALHALYAACEAS